MSETQLSLPFLRTSWSNKPEINLSVVKYAKSILVCRTCKTEGILIITGIYLNGEPIYFCPKCEKQRNRQQRSWMEFDTRIQFKKVLEDSGFENVEVKEMGQ